MKNIPLDMLGIGKERSVIKSLWHIVVPWKSRKVQPKNSDFSDSVITDKPNDLVHVCSTLGTAGKTSLSTPSSLSFWTEKMVKINKR